MFLDLVTRSAIGRPLSWVEEDGNLNAISQAIEALDGEQVYTRLRGNVIDVLGPVNTPVNGQVRGEYLRYLDHTAAAGYGVRRTDYTKFGRLLGGANDIAEASIARWCDIASGFVWGKWDVAQSPLFPGSGLVGEPTQAQSFAVIVREANPQNRYAQLPDFQPETRLYSNWTGGDQMVAETQDFTALQGAKRIGYDCAFGWLLSMSSYRSNAAGDTTDRHARYMVGWLTHPNTIAPTGYGHFMTGFRPFVKDVQVVNPGAGYRARDAVFLSTGISAALANEAMILITAVDGSGAITACEVFAQGSYTQSFSQPVASVSLQGASATPGTGATFNVTLSTPTGELPRAAFGLSGRWLYGIDFCPNPDTLIASVANAFIRLPNGGDLSAGGLVFKGTGGGDVAGMNVNAADELIIGHDRVLPETAWSPAVTSDTVAFTTVSVPDAHYHQSNRRVDGQLTVTLTTKGSGAGGLRVPLPVPAASYNFAAWGYDTVSGVALVGRRDAATSYIRFVLASTGGDPLVDGHGYVLTFNYPSAT